MRLEKTIQIVCDKFLPPWAFSGAATATVLDLFQRGDRFELFDNSVSLGLTSAPPNDGANPCGASIAVCLVASGYGVGVYNLGSGAHSLTILVNQFTLAGGGGAAAFQVGTPEPGTLVMPGMGLAGLGLFRYRKA